MNRLENRIVRRHRKAGFSLIELLAVMVILGILMVFLVPKLLEKKEVAKQLITEEHLQQISSAIAVYEGEMGDYPPSSWKGDWGPVPNNINLGGEILCVCLWSDDFGGTSLSEDDLINSDEDRGKKNLTTHANNDLFELRDTWDNPIAYFHRRDYGREDLYTTIDENGEIGNSNIKALVNPKTGNPYNPRKFQLISAGADGLFATEDDLGNFRVRID